MKQLMQIMAACALVMVLLASCSKQSDNFSTEPLSDYYPISSGSVFIYRLDSSLIAIDGSSVLDVRSYLLKDSIADTLRDNAGRLSYRVYRSITDTLQTTAYKAIGTYSIIPTSTSIEVLDENNLRFVKLAEPLRDGYSWHGNEFIDTRSSEAGYQYLDGWNYQYQNFAMPFTVNMGTLSNTITVLQQDEVSPPGDFDPNFYQQRNYSVEVYAQGIGLVYKKFLHSTWQLDPPPAHYDSGTYGIELNLVNYHN